MNIKDIKKEELEKILDFYNGINEYGYIYHFSLEKLNEPFNKILEGIDEINKLMKDSFEM